MIKKSVMKTYFYQARCDQCDNESEDFVSYIELINWLNLNGWRVNDEDYPNGETDNNHLVMIDVICDDCINILLTQ